MEETKPSKDIPAAIENFINSSMAYITINTVKQLRKGCNTIIKHCLNFSSKYYCKIEYIKTYKIAYLHISLEYGFSAILKFYSIHTIKYLCEEFNFIPVTVKSNCNNCYTLNYDEHEHEHEHEIIQDNYAYNAFVNEQSSNHSNIFIIDKRTRTLAFDITTINIKTSIFIEPFTKMTLIALKG